MVGNLIMMFAVFGLMSTAGGVETGSFTITQGIAYTAFFVAIALVGIILKGGE